MKCLRCNNEDNLYFYNDRGTYYCRKCASFGRLDIHQTMKKMMYKKPIQTSHPILPFVLTPYQQEVCTKVLTSLRNKKDVFVYATTGAGKTEIATMALYEYLKQRKKVGFAISRRQVVLEIKDRLQAYFPSLKVVAVCEGYTNEIDGDIIVCTMHQLYRYVDTFDLLIMDEMDAFPYRDNEVLESVAKHACKGEKMYLSATPDEKILQEVQEGNIDMVELFVRPHGKPLVVPKVVYLFTALQVLYLYFFLRRKKKEKIPVLVFVPTIAFASTLERILKVSYRCASFTSKTLYKEEILQAFKNQEYDFLISTTILERGITIKGIDVIVLEADHVVFHEASLVQIAGRVGRDMEKSSGEVLFLCKKKSKNVTRCISIIERMNKSI